MVKRILVTGGAGYIGSHITELLIKKKKKVFIVDNLSTGFKKFLNKKAIFFKTDIHNLKKINQILKKNNIETIVHLAASLLIEESERSPKKYFKNNVEGTKKLLLALKDTSVKNFIFSSTAAIYKDGQFKVNENSLIKPKSIYGKTKVSCEKLITKYCSKYKINYAILRYFNIAGSSDSGKIGLLNKSDHLFKNYSREIMKKKPLLRVYGSNYNTEDGSCIRDFIHVSDIADIHYKVLQKINIIKKSKIFNCGYNKGTSVLEVAKEFQRQSSKKVKILITKRRKGDLVKIIASNKKLIKFINWKPKYNNLRKIVQSCLNWEKKIK